MRLCTCGQTEFWLLHTGAVPMNFKLDTFHETQKLSSILAGLSDVVSKILQEILPSVYLAASKQTKFIFIAQTRYFDNSKSIRIKQKRTETKKLIKKSAFTGGST